MLTKWDLPAAFLVTVLSVILIQLVGWDYEPGRTIECEDCAADIGDDMPRAGHVEDMLWRGALAVRDVKPLQRYLRPNRLFNLDDDLEETRPCLACHDGQTADTFAIMWTKFPRYNPEKGRYEDFSRAIQDELKLRYNGTLPVRSDTRITLFYIYAFTKAKQAGLTFDVESADDPALSDAEFEFLAPPQRCRDMFAKFGRPRGSNAEAVIRGCSLMVDTHANTNPMLRFWRTDVNCESCHRDAGNRPYASSIAHGAVLLPIMMTPLNRPIRFNRRVLMCYARSLNWFDLGRDAPEITYIRIYANWLAQKQDFKIGKLYKGRGIQMMFDTQARGSSILAGELVYQNYCVGCHGKNGWGGQGDVFLGRQPPPITGPNAFNGTATTSRRERLAGFVYYNMPPGATAEAPVLTVQQTLDVAVYLAALGRPSDFTKTNQVATFMNYVWLKTIDKVFRNNKHTSPPDDTSTEEDDQ